MRNVFLLFLLLAITNTAFADFKKPFDQNMIQAIYIPEEQRGLTVHTLTYQTAFIVHMHEKEVIFDFIGDCPTITIIEDRAYRKLPDGCTLAIFYNDDGNDNGEEYVGDPYLCSNKGCKRP
ncbi:MAG: hypothetical protein FWG39_02450 [Alphaproteobacteria bacterium]|nr:hypothetical protein [Alphaproteobacteria bacterium]